MFSMQSVCSTTVMNKLALIYHKSHPHALESNTLPALVSWGSVGVEVVKFKECLGKFTLTFATPSFTATPPLLVLPPP